MTWHLGNTQSAIQSLSVATTWSDVRNAGAW